MGGQLAGYAATMALGLVPSLLFSWAAAVITDNNNWKGFFIAFAALLGLYFSLWLIRSIWSWLVFGIYGKRGLARTFEKFFVANQFPVPDKRATDLDDYLTQISDDEAVDCSLRVKAAFELGTLNGLKTTGNVQMLLRINMAAKLAMSRYARI